MEFQQLLSNFTNPALLFFFLGIFAVRIKSDLEIPATSSRFISIYLLFSIGFKGGQELAHGSFSAEIGLALLFGVFMALAVPLYAFFILKRNYSIANAGAIAAAYGSVSAVTFVTAVSYLDLQSAEFGGHMVAVMAMMEAPAIIVGVILMRYYEKDQPATSMKGLIFHSMSNGSVLMVMGSLLIGLCASPEQAEGIKPFTTDIFKGFLAVFLLDMGISSGRKLSSLTSKGIRPFAFAIIVPLINGCLFALLSSVVTDVQGNRFLFAILGASASYIAVPAAMKLAAPKANPGLYIPMSLAITFPVNITIGMPIYYYLAGLSY